MTIQEIIDAIKSGNKVWWYNTRYEVMIDAKMPTGLATWDIYNGYYIGLAESELEGCFI